MRKFFAATLALALFSAPAFARTYEGPDAARHAHRAEKAAERKARGPEMREEHANKDAGNSFWKREGERSGLGNSGERVGSFFKRLNPMPFLVDQEKKYNERKGGAASAK